MKGRNHGFHGLPFTRFILINPATPKRTIHDFPIWFTFISNTKFMFHNESLVKVSFSLKRKDTGPVPLPFSHRHQGIYRFWVVFLFSETPFPYRGHKTTRLVFFDPGTLPTVFFFFEGSRTPSSLVQLRITDGDGLLDVETTRVSVTV